MEQKTKEKVMEIRGLSITFNTMAGDVHAIRGVDIDLNRGETLAIVGESGSGKSVTMKAAIGILARNATVGGGTIQYTYRQDNGDMKTVDILKMKKKELRDHINGKRIAMIFQDPMTSLDPTMPIGKQIIESMLWHKRATKKEATSYHCREK
jgi:oligopeptide transport system ATP-binding protein